MKCAAGLPLPNQTERQEQAGALRSGNAVARERAAWINFAKLFFENFFNLADFLYDLAADFFALALGFKVGIVRRAADLFLDAAFHFMELAFGLVLRALLHGDSPLGGPGKVSRPAFRQPL
jgi:hypothetical protein